MSNSKYKNKISPSKPRKSRLARRGYLVLTSNFFSCGFFMKIQCIYHMSTLARRQINVMMRPKFHFQIIQNLAQVTKFSSHFPHLS